MGDYNIQVDGDYNLGVKGKTNIRSHGDMSISGDDYVSLTANENFGGQLQIGAGDSLYIASDLVVGGSIQGDLITAKTRINAGTGVYAGPLGFVSGEGGLSLGIPSPVTPVAVPGCIYTVGTINSAVAVNAPVGNFGIANCGIMDAVLMTDVLNSKIYDTHIHPAPRGVTGPPATPFIGV